MDASLSTLAGSFLANRFRPRLNQVVNGCVNGTSNDRLPLSRFRMAGECGPACAYCSQHIGGCHIMSIFRHSCRLILTGNKAYERAVGKPVRDLVVIRITRSGKGTQVCRCVGCRGRYKTGDRVQVSTPSISLKTGSDSNLRRQGTDRQSTARQEQAGSGAGSG